MGKRIPSSSSSAAAANIKSYARIASERIKPSKPQHPKTLAPPPPLELHLNAQKPAAPTTMDAGGPREARQPLSAVVADCVRRWFQDALREAKGGDQAMRVLVGQMYYHGYGVGKNGPKAKAWISEVSKYRPSVWKVSKKRPGYNASDSDSDEVEDDNNR